MSECDNQAVINNNIKQLKAILMDEAAGTELSNVKEWNWTLGEAPLHQAALQANAEMVKVLIEAGCEVNR